MTPFSSSLFHTRVLHERSQPREHRFVYPLFYFGLDLDELAKLDHRLRLFSVNRRNLFSFHEKDYLPIDEPGLPGAVRRCPEGLSLKQRVLFFLGEQGLKAGADTRVFLITLPRMLGYLFNPVSFYFCTSPSGEPLAAIAEVTNTFHERKLFLVPPVGNKSGAPRFRLKSTKHFYVSPFSPLDDAFIFRLGMPAEKLALCVDIVRGPQRLLHSTLTGSRGRLSDAALLGCLLRYPFATLAVTLRIHWHALLLWLKGAPFFRKADNPQLQRGLHRPHSSLTKASSS